jgi:Rod binding domain-containing protein
MSDLALTRVGSLRAAGEHDQLRKAAQQFEAIFLQKLLQPLADHQVDDEPLVGGSSAERTFRGLHHQGLSEQVAGGLGIADAVFRELSVRSTLPADTSTGAKP